MDEKLIAELHENYPGELIFLYRIGGDGPIEDIWAGRYCNDSELDFFREWVNPDASSYSFRELQVKFNRFIVCPAVKALKEMETK